LNKAKKRTNDETDMACLLADLEQVDLNVVDSEQSWTLLMHAVFNNNEIIVDKLLERKCDVNFVDKTGGETPLHLAVMNESDFIVKILIKASASKTVRNFENFSALDLERANDSEELFQI
jgi:ankyrin repeat protein